MHARTRNFLSLTIALGLVFAITAKAFLVPFVQRHVKSKLESLTKNAPAEVQFREVKVLWNGIRLKGVRVKKQDHKLEANVSLTLGFDSQFPFIKPSLLTLEKARIEVVRNPLARKLELAPDASLNAVNYSLSELMDRYFSSGISLRIKHARVKINTGSGETLVSVPNFSAELNAKDRSVQIDAGDFYFREIKVLSEVSGQLLLQKQREYYPFLLQARDPGGEPWQLKGQISHDFDSLDVRHKRKGLPEAWAEKGRFIANPDEVLMLLNSHIEGLVTREQISFRIRMASSNLFIQHESLGRKALGPWPLVVSSKGVLIPEPGRLEISEGHATLASRTQEAPLALSFEARKESLSKPLATDPFRIRFHMTKQSCQSVLDSVPENVLPLLEDLKLEGDFAIDGEARILIVDDFLRLTPGLNRMNCSVKHSPKILTREWLFQRDTELPEELRQNPALRAVKMGKPIPRSQIPDDFFKAVVSAEDARFWRHEGILVDSLLNAVQQNLKAGRSKFGGSTITMQLAKNLYLDRDKVISRKLQEMALAWVLEQNLTKAEILELYANAIEFGPNTYGIQKAARLYFNKAASEMNTAESLFLASILPNPSKNFSDSFCQARLSNGIKNRMQNVATSLNLLSQERDFMKLYSSELENFNFGMNLGGCETIDRNRLSQRDGKRRETKTAL